MNGWLVLGRCGMDDIPLRLYADRKLAEVYASNVEEVVVRNTANAVLDMTVSHVIGTCLVQFVDGIPIGRLWVKDFPDTASDGA